MSKQVYEILEAHEADMQNFKSILAIVLTVLSFALVFAVAIFMN